MKLNVILLTLLCVFTNAAYTQINDGNTMTASTNFACTVATGKTVDAFHSGQENDCINGNCFWWGLDIDGAWNYGGGPVSDSAFDGDDRFTNQGPDNNPTRITWGGKSNSNSACAARCDSIGDRCAGYTFQSNPNEFDCYLFHRCSPIDDTTAGKLGRSGHVKTAFSGFTAVTVKPQATCVGTSTFGPDLLGLNNPVNPQECYDKCKTFTGTTYFVLNRGGECQCFSTCTIQQYAVSSTNVDVIMGGDLGHSTVYEFSEVTQSPTPNPTPEPTTPPPTTTPPTNPPNTPTTTSPSPTPLPTTLPPSPTAPTEQPITNPPTFPPSTGASSDNDDGERAIAIAIGVSAGALAFMCLGGILIYRVTRVQTPYPPQYSLGAYNVGNLPRRFDPQGLQRAASEPGGFL